ncbi:branched-chain amino acid ABC transporter permease [Halorientalis brevis]|uniref:Branched-chain amino acid ABC transporter permease n=1 Tax=Halorientalis brevis TaxID=1126241 RepID=A0ABD6CBI9_9EURY|nr:branched-chain amino acid ABC transporter permease [Halorientalis brevis]
MEVRETVHQGRRLLVERPGQFAVTAVAVLLVIDLVRQIVAGQTLISTVAGYVWNGTVIGLIIGLAGIGLSLTYSILNFANFSHGDYLTTGAFSGWTASYLVAGFGTASLGDLLLLNVSPRDIGINVAAEPLSVVFGLLVAIGMTVLVALGIDRFVYKPMRDADGISLLIASIGVALALRYLVVFVYGTNLRGLTAGDVPKFSLTIVDGAITIDAHELTLVVSSVLLMLGIHVLLQRTKFGKAMRAMSDNKDLARVTGIPTERVIQWTWIIGAGLAGSAGYLIALKRGSMGFNLGWVLLLLIFAAVILGGIGSIYGAMIGGVIIGIVRNVSLLWLPTDFSLAAAFLIMILILLFRPEGIFGGVKTA